MKLSKITKKKIERLDHPISNNRVGARVHRCVKCHSNIGPDEIRFKISGVVINRKNRQIVTWLCEKCYNNLIGE